jgi:hypothetical protein
MQSQPSSQPILITGKPSRQVDYVGAFFDAARLPGQSPLRLGRRLLRCTMSPQYLTVPTFFRLGLYRPEMSGPEVAAFIGGVSNYRFNRLLNGPSSENETEALKDKLETAHRLALAGIPTAKVLAVYPGHHRSGAATVLTSASEIEAYLLRPESTPCFGKPILGGAGNGVVAIEGSPENGNLLLGNGRVISAAALAQEIVGHYSKGYMFQELLRASDEVRALSGPGIPSVRIYTLWLEGGPRPLYASARLPAPSAMSDDDAIPGIARLHLDLETGAILRAQDNDKDAGHSVTLAPVTGIRLEGQAFPDWQRTVATAVETHRQFPKHRAVGVDLAPTDRGLIVNEANATPGSKNYQLASLIGMLNPKFSPLFRQALAERGVKRPVRGVPWPSG